LCLVFGLGLGLSFQLHPRGIVAVGVPFGLLGRWADTVLRQHYGGYEPRDCCPATSTPSGNCLPWPLNGTTPIAEHAPTSPGALEFYDRWLPGTMRRINAITGKCVPECVMVRGPGDWAARPRYR
jgi:hypothetical protein